MSLDAACLRVAKVPPFLFRKPAFPSYDGPVKSKFTALSQARFSICFENARDIRGYLTEKILINPPLTYNFSVHKYERLYDRVEIIASYNNTKK